MWSAAGLALLASALRALVARSIPVVQQDAAGGYLPQAREILQGHWIEGLGTYFPPGYPLTVAFLSLTGLSVETAGKLVSILAGTLLLIPVFRIARRLLDERTAWVAAVLTACYPVTVLHSADAVSEGLYTLLVLLAVDVALSALRSESPRAWGGAGALLGGAYLVRGEALGMAALLVLFGIAEAALPSANRAGKAVPRPRRRGRCVAAAAAGFLALMLPYALVLGFQTKSVQLSGKTIENLLAYDIRDDGQPVDMEKVRLGLTPDQTRLQMDDEKKQSALVFAWQNRERLVRKYILNASKAYATCLPHTIFPAFLALLGIGLYRTMQRRDRLVPLGLLGCFFLFPFLFYPIFLVEDRYFAPVAPLGLILAAGGIESVADSLGGIAGRDGRTNGWLAGITAMLILAHVWPLAQEVRKNPWEYPLEHRQAGLWLLERDGARRVIMNRKSYAAFYADGVSVLTPDADYAGVLAYARARGVDYLIVDERYTLPVRPGLRFLLESETSPPELEKVYDREDGPGRRIVVFRFRDRPSSSTTEGSTQPASW